MLKCVYLSLPLILLLDNPVLPTLEKRLGKTVLCFLSLLALLLMCIFKEECYHTVFAFLSLKVKPLSKIFINYSISTDK